MIRLGTAMIGVLAAVVGAALVSSAAAQGYKGYPYSIMVPEEPWLAPKFKSPRGLKQTVTPPRVAPAPPPAQIAKPAPPIVLPGVTNPIPNLAPVPRGSVPGGGSETFGDRVSRCAQQGAAFGVPGDKSSVYAHTCAMR